MGGKPGVEARRAARHADDQAPGQTFLELHLLKKHPERIAATRATLDEMLRTPQPGRVDCGGSTRCSWLRLCSQRLYAVTRNEKYIDYLDTMWWDPTDFLFDQEAGLYYRDANYLGKLNSNGKKVFWARGNGWVMSGPSACFSTCRRIIRHAPATSPC